MPLYDTDYQAYRRDVLNRLVNMDPDDIVSELGVDSYELVDALWATVERYIEQEYKKETNQDDDDDKESDDAL